MKYKTLINNIKIPVIGLGTRLIGGGKEAVYINDKQEIQAIKDAIDIGYTHIDTAESYGNGHTEEIIGKAIKDFDREKLFITSKVRNTKLKYDDVIKSVEESLKRLKTTYIDLFLIHAYNEDISLKETIKAFDYLVDKGLIKYIGVSNFQVWQIKEAQSYTKNKIVANQIEYNLLTRNKSRYGKNIDMESKIIPYCQKNNIIIMAELPIVRGMVLQKHPLLDKLEKKYNKTKVQISLAWLISKANIVAIPKSTNIKHLKENIKSTGFVIEEKDIKLLDNIKF